MRQIILAINALLKFKAYTLINVLGLACSLACVLTVARYIHQENTVNQCFPEYKRICLIKTSTSSGENFLGCLLYTSPSPRDLSTSRMPSSA